MRLLTTETPMTGVGAERARATRSPTTVRAGEKAGQTGWLLGRGRGAVVKSTRREVATNVENWLLATGDFVSVLVTGPFPDHPPVEWCTDFVQASVSVGVRVPDLHWSTVCGRRCG